jgi:bifunctional oligoribonuclease and PAP phosphatase NrnA
MTIDWQPLRDVIETNDRFVLSSHARPDADAIGSELGLAGLLEQMGKSVRIVNPSAAPSNIEFLDPGRRVLVLGDTITEDEALEADVHIVVDTSAWSQLGPVGGVLKKTQACKIVIDHHVSSDDLGALEFKDGRAEATGALIFRLAEFLGSTITPVIATALYTAIATDTGWFRFPSTTGDTMRIIGRLIDFGASPPLIYQSLYEQYSLARVRLAGRVLGRVEVECNGRLAYVWVRHDDFAATGAGPADTEDLVNECLRIAGTDCAFILVEQKDERVKVSFRSRTDVNVAAIAEQFGGGGHKQAAGAGLSGSLTEALAKVLSAMKAALVGESG